MGKSISSASGRGPRTGGHLVSKEVLVRAVLGMEMNLIISREANRYTIIVQFSQHTIDDTHRAIKPGR